MAELQTAEDFKDVPMTDLLANAQYELDTRARGYPTGLGFVRVLGGRFRELLAQDKADDVWRMAFDRAVPGRQPAAERQAMLRELLADMAGLEGYFGKGIAREKIDGMIVFMTAYYDVLKRAEPMRVKEALVACER